MEALTPLGVRLHCVDADVCSTATTANGAWNYGTDSLYTIGATYGATQRKHVQNFWEETIQYHIPAMGIEVYLRMTFGSPEFDGGTQPSMNLLFEQSLPLRIGYEYNFGIAGIQNRLGQTTYQFNFACSSPARGGQGLRYFR